MILGCIWEFYEFLMAGGVEFWAERGVNSAWDIWFNMLGYRLGENLILYFGVDAARKFAQILFWFGIVLTTLVACVSIFRREISVGWIELIVFGFGLLVYRRFFT